MQKVNGRTHGNGDSFFVRALLSYLKAEWMSFDLSCNGRHVLVFSQLGYRFSVWFIHYGQISISNPLAICTTLKRACTLTNVKIRW